MGATGTSHARKTDHMCKRIETFIANSSGGGISGVLDSHYYLGQGARGGVEREFIVMELKEPNAFCFDARGNGDGKTCCSLVGGHQATISDYTAIIVERMNVEILEQRRDSRNAICEQRRGGTKDAGQRKL